MDYTYANHYNDLLTRRCACGGTGEMLCDFVADFSVRCSSCHLSTHAYIEPEDAAALENALIISRDIVPYGEISPSIDGDYPLK